MGTNYWDSGILNRDGVGVMDTNRNRYDRNTKVKGMKSKIKIIEPVQPVEVFRIHASYQKLDKKGKRRMSYSLMVWAFKEWIKTF